MKKTENESQKNKVYVTNKEPCVYSLQPSPQGINFVIVNNNIISLQQGDFYITLFDRPNLQIIHCFYNIQFLCKNIYKIIFGHMP